MKYVLGFLATMALGMVNPTHAGQIEIGGAWYTPEELLQKMQEPKKGEDRLIVSGKSARVLLLPGFWRTDNDHLSKRFWGLAAIKLEVREVYGVFRASFFNALTIPTRDAPIALTIGTHVNEMQSRNLEYFTTIARAALSESRTARHLLPCIEISGDLSARMEARLEIPVVA